MANSYGYQTRDWGEDFPGNGGTCFDSQDFWRERWSVAPPPEALESRSGRAGVLAGLIEGEVIPRLLLAHREPTMTAEPAMGSTIVRPLPNYDRFAKDILEQDFAILQTQVLTLMGQGVDIDRICMELLAPVARLMGIYWVEDRWSFADVTLGLGRLHQLLHEFSRLSEPLRQPSGSAGRAFFSPVPGEQHTFGLVMIEDFFRRSGWMTTCDVGATESAICRALSQDEYDVAGFSVGCEEFLGPLSALIDKARGASLRRDIQIFVGGRIFNEQPSLRRMFQNVVIASDCREALHLADAMLPQIQGQTSRALM